MSTSDHDTTPKLTYDDYLLLPDDGLRHEIIDGRHYMNPAPNSRHQTVSRYIQFQLFQQIELAGLGQVFNAPADLVLSSINIVQPDLIVVLKSNPIINAANIRGIPDLVVEILSPSNRRYDLKLKKRLYEELAVPEFWVVDPDQEWVEQNQLSADGTYVASVQRDVIEYRWNDGMARVDLQFVWRGPFGVR
jgi:Uma2 family endonuclease